MSSHSDLVYTPEESHFCGQLLESITSSEILRLSFLLHQYSFCNTRYFLGVFTLALGAITEYITKGYDTELYFHFDVLGIVFLAALRRDD